MSGLWSVGDAAASIVTALIAGFVFMEARSIRTTEWLTRSVSMWQSFNQMLMEEDRAARWRRLLTGELPARDVTAADHYVLFSYVNIIYVEYRMARRRLLNRDYALESVADNVKQLAPSSEFIVPLLRFTGYDNEFVDLIEAVANCGDAGAQKWIRRRRPLWPWRPQ